MAKAPEPPPPRKDGFDQRQGRWKDLGVGMTIERGGRRWTIIDSAIPPQFQYGYSLWFRFQAPKGETFNCAPKPLVTPVTILSKPGEDLPPPTLPVGHAEAALLVESLGATEIATKDEASGEIWCPAHTTMHTGDYGRGEILHLQLAHGLDTSALEALPLAERAVALVKAHGPLHFKNAEALATASGRGFPHRHVPEELDQM